MTKHKLMAAAGGCLALAGILEVVTHQPIAGAVFFLTAVAIAVAANRMWRAGMTQTPAQPGHAEKPE